MTNFNHKQTDVDHGTFFSKILRSTKILNYQLAQSDVENENESSLLILFKCVKAMNFPCFSGKGLICLQTINLARIRNVILNEFLTVAPWQNRVEDSINCAFKCKFSVTFSALWILQEIYARIYVRLPVLQPNQHTFSGRGSGVIMHNDICCLFHIDLNHTISHEPY